MSFAKLELKYNITVLVVVFVVLSDVAVVRVVEVDVVEAVVVLWKTVVSVAEVGVVVLYVETDVVEKLEPVVDEVGWSVEPT